MNTDTAAVPATVTLSSTAPKWNEISVTLRFPVTIGDAAPVAAITLREPDLEALETLEDLGLVENKAPTLRQSRQIIAALSGQPDAVLLKLHRSDVLEIIEKMTPLLEGEMAA